MGKKWGQDSIQCNFMGKRTASTAKNINVNINIKKYNVNSVDIIWLKFHHPMKRNHAWTAIRNYNAQGGPMKKNWDPHKHASCQFCTAGRWEQVCSSACCSLAWVNKEKTGAIWQTCQAWNSLLMFTPFTLELLQFCLSPDFWQGPTAICF